MTVSIGIDIGGTKCALSVGECASDSVKILHCEEFPTKGKTWQEVPCVGRLLRKGLAVLLSVLGSTGLRADVARYVDPFVGTSRASHGHTFPGAVRPAGLVQPGPDTGWAGWDHCSGYVHDDSHVYGFSQTHLSGTGCAELGDLLLQPFTGEIADDGTCRGAVDRRTERAEPGYYTVVMTNLGVRAEVTAARRVAFHRWTFPQGRQARVLVDAQWGVNTGGDPRRFNHILEYSGLVSSDKTRIVGGYTHRAWLPREVHFILEFSRPFRDCRQLPMGKTEKAPRYVLDFDLPEGERLLARVAISTTDEAGAFGNLAAEATWDFDAVHAACRDEWNRLLGRIEFPGATEEQKTKLYTAIYHSYILPNDLADADGRYRGPDGKVARAASGAYYTGLSLWDTFRAVHPFYTLFSPERVMPIVESMMANYRACGFLPVIPYFGRESFCMIGNHSVPVLVDACLKGFGPDYDWKAVFAAVDDSLSRTHPGKRKEDWDCYDRYGYYPFDKVKWESVSRTLECGYDDWCAARLAEKVGSPRRSFYEKRARYYRNLFDQETGFFRAKDSEGRWIEPFNPCELGHAGLRPNPYTEGNAWQYLWHVLQDPEDLVRLLGGKEAFAAKLDQLFVVRPDVEGLKRIPDVSGLIGLYAQGNEPSHHVAYLYQYADRPRETARRIRDICDTFYKTGPGGLCGNDDCGQMSIWYVFACLGFYPVNPCGGEYIIGAPQVPAAQVKVGGEGERRMFNVLAKGLSEENKYVKSVTLNGKPITDWKIHHADIVKGGELVFEMGDKE